MKKLLIGALALATAAFINPASADTTITANGGAVTQYIFRGIPQSDGKAAAQGGLDLDINGFFLGTWFSQVDTSARTATGDIPASGLEYDLYAGYAFEIDDFSFGIGGTGYFYTDDFDEEYIELNLSAGWRFITIDYAIGEYDAPLGNSSSQDYTFGSVTLEYNGFYGLVGSWGDDFDGTYFEVGYGSTLTVADKDLFDYTFAIIRSDEDLSFKVDSNGNATEDTFFYAGVVKYFELFSN
ncbi:MAG: TorF family putative porin [Gammaproteobacteria bacterium]